MERGPQEPDAAKNESIDAMSEKNVYSSFGDEYQRPRTLHTEQLSNFVLAVCTYHAARLTTPLGSHLFFWCTIAQGVHEDRFGRVALAADVEHDGVAADYAEANEVSEYGVIERVCSRGDTDFVVQGLLLWIDGAIHTYVGFTFDTAVLAALFMSSPILVNI